MAFLSCCHKRCLRLVLVCLERWLWRILGFCLGMMAQRVIGSIFCDTYLAPKLGWLLSSYLLYEDSNFLHKLTLSFCVRKVCSTLYDRTLRSNHYWRRVSSRFSDQIKNTQHPMHAVSQLVPCSHFMSWVRKVKLPRQKAIIIETRTRPELWWRGMRK